MELARGRRSGLESASAPLGRSRRWPLIWLLLCCSGALAVETDGPRVLLCDAVDGIAVIEHLGVEQALQRGQADQSGRWRLIRVAADSVVLESTAGESRRIRAYLASSGRGPVQFDERPPPNRSARSLVVVPARLKPNAPEER